MDVEPNAELRAKRAAGEVALPTGPRLSFEDLAKRYGITLEQLASMVEREKRRTDLTAREREILIIYASGKQRKEIAADLELSLRTVHTHLDNCQRKLGLNTKTKALHYCILAGWIEVGAELSDEARASAQKAKREAVSE